MGGGVPLSPTSRKVRRASAAQQAADTTAFLLENLRLQHQQQQEEAAIAQEQAVQQALRRQQREAQRAEHRTTTIRANAMELYNARYAQRVYNSRLGELDTRITALSRAVRHDTPRLANERQQQAADLTEIEQLEARLAHLRAVTETREATINRVATRLANNGAELQRLNGYRQEAVETGRASANTPPNADQAVENALWDECMAEATENFDRPPVRSTARTTQRSHTSQGHRPSSRNRSRTGRHSTSHNLGPFKPPPRA